MKTLEYKKDGQITDYVDSFGHEGTEFLNYSFKPVPTFIDKKSAYSKTYLGIELEYREDEDYAEDEHLSIFHERVYMNQDFPPMYYVKHDSSFHGPEFVFQPMSFLGAVELYRKGYWKRFFEAKDEFYTTGSDVGMHVHIDKKTGTERIMNRVLTVQNMTKIAYSLRWLYNTDEGLFRAITKRKSLRYCEPNVIIREADHNAAINETSRTYEFRFWAAPKTLGRFMYCLAATQAGNIISRNSRYSDKREIIRDMFITIPRKIEKTLKIKLAYPRGLKKLEELVGA